MTSTVEKRVLFLCSGNYYRSRFAEAVFNHHAIRRGLPWRAFSRGLAIYLVDGDLSPHTEDALAERGIDRSLTGSTRIPLAEDDLRGADRVVALKEAEHRPMMQQQFPGWVDRISYWSVHDLDCAGPEEALPQIERQVMALAGELERPPPS
jgi:protein-tyrosine phosphatase